MKKLLCMQHCAQIGGGSWCLLEIIQEVDLSIYKVEVVLGEDGPLRKHLEKMGIVVHTCLGFPVLNIAYPSYCKLFSLATLKQIFLLPSRIFQLLQLFKRIRPSVVYLNSIIQFPIAVIAKRCGISHVVLHIREHYCLSSMDPRSFFWKKTAARYIDRIVSISKCGATLAGVDNKALVARDWADFATRGEVETINIFDQYNLPSEKPMVLLTGGNSMQKGSLSAVKSFLQANNTDSICVILGGVNIQKMGPWGNFREKAKMWVGINPDWYELMRLAEASDRIYLLPSVLCVKQFMEAAKVIICAYRIPHCAKPAIEAGILSRTAIVADNPEGLEYVKDGVTGFVVSHGDINTLAEKIDAILSGSVDTDQMGMNAKAYVEDEFSKVKSMQNIMASIAGSTSGTS